MNKIDSFTCCKYKNEIHMPIKIIPENRVTGKVVLKPLKDKWPCSRCECLLTYYCISCLPCVPCFSDCFPDCAPNDSNGGGYCDGVCRNCSCSGSCYCPCTFQIDVVAEFVQNLLVLVLIQIDAVVEFAQNLLVLVVAQVDVVAVVVEFALVLMVLVVVLIQNAYLVVAKCMNTVVKFMTQMMF